MKTLAVVACLLLVGCGDRPTVSDRKSITGSEFRVVIDRGFNDRVVVVTVDGCEYVIYEGSYRGGIVHKANCPNLEHRSRP